MTTAPSGRHAHRPSRRDGITAAATKVFAEVGVAGATVQGVAAEAGVAAAAVYYHFASKEALFEAALCRAMESAESLVNTARAGLDLDDTLAVGRVMEAVWQWTVDNPDEAALLSGPITATPGSRRLREEWEERHVTRGYAYLPAPDGSTPTETERLRRELAVRTLIRLSISVHILRQPDGPLNRNSPHALSKAVRDVCNRLVR